MKFITLLSLFFLFSCASIQKNKIEWTVTDNIKNPESVLFDSQSQRLYVSNVDGAGNGLDRKGHIMILDLEGNVIDRSWVTGLNAPKGSRIHGNTFWVSDINRVVKIDLKTGKILKFIYIKGSKFLNDIAITPEGTVYVSDTIASKIYKISNDIPSVFVKGPQYNSPNGLLLSGNDLVVAAWGLTTDWSTKIPGHLYKINLKTKKMSNITNAPLGNLDGLEFDKDMNYIVSDWVSGMNYKVNKSGEVEPIYQGVKGNADIGFDSKGGILYIPDMLENRIIKLTL